MSNSQIGEKAGKRAAIRAGVAIAIFVGIIGLIMLLSPDQLYNWLKAFHVIAIIAWMAGMLYLPRLFVYHAGAEVGSETSETFKVMERRLLKVIMNPAMIISWILGLWLAWMAGFFGEPWFWIKIVAVLGMTAAHGSLAKAVRLFANDRNQRSARAWRMINEVPTVLMFIAVLAVILKPF
ncbi:MAG: protoporphyrinogen oxidase HemJ [Pseudomonadota bacterium]